MTAGAFGALGVTIRALCDEGDEVIFLSPPWFFYELMIASSGATRRACPAARRPTSTSIPTRSPRPSPREPGRSSSTARTTRPVGSIASPSSPRSADVLRDGLRAPRPTDRAALRRVVQPDRVRRHRLPQPGARLRRDDHDLHLRQDAAGARASASATRRCTRTSPTARRSTTGSSSSSWRPAGASRTRCSSTRSATSKALSIDIGALQARRDRMVPALRELGYEVTEPGGHVLPAWSARPTRTTSRSRRGSPSSARSCCRGRSSNRRAGSGSRSRRATRWSSRDCGRSRRRAGTTLPERLAQWPRAAETAARRVTVDAYTHPSA